MRLRDRHLRLRFRDQIGRNLSTAAKSDLQRSHLYYVVCYAARINIWLYSLPSLPSEGPPPTRVGGLLTTQVT